MAGTTSIGGLVSGLDTAGIVSQLMQLEKVPQNKLKSQVSSTESKVSALQTINARTAALATQAEGLTKADTWGTLKTTSSLAGVTVKAASSASLTNLQVKVNTLASSYGVTLTGSAGLKDEAVPLDLATQKHVLTIRHADGRVVEVDTRGGTLEDVAAALNDPANETGVKATLLQVGTGSYRLLVDSTSTGVDSSFTLSTGAADAPGAGELMGGIDDARTRFGTNAEIEIGGFALSSSSNIFDEVMPGVSITLATNTKIGETSEVTISRDAATQATAVKSLVDNINSLISSIQNQTSYDTATGKSGALSSDSTVRALSNALATSLYPGDGTSMAEFGLQVDRYGKLVFDEETFTKAYEADPAKVASAFATGEDSFASRVQKVSKQYSDPTDGMLTKSIEGHQSTITRLNQSITDWDLRLELRQSTLERTYAALESALARLNSTGDYISSQVSSWNAKKE